MTWRADTESTHAEYPTERRAQLAADVLTMLGKGPVVVWDAGDAPEGGSGLRGCDLRASGSGNEAVVGPDAPSRNGTIQFKGKP